MEKHYPINKTGIWLIMHIQNKRSEMPFTVVHKIKMYGN